MCDFLIIKTNHVTKKSHVITSLDLLTRKLIEVGRETNSTHFLNFKDNKRQPQGVGFVVLKVS